MAQDKTRGGPSSYPKGEEVLCQFHELTCQDDLSYQSTMWRKSNTTQYNTVYAFLYAYVLRTV